MSSSDDVCVQLRQLQQENAELKRREDTVNSQYGRLKELIQKIRTAEGDKAHLQRELDAVKLEAARSKQACQAATIVEGQAPKQQPQQRDGPQGSRDLQHEDPGAQASAHGSAMGTALQDCQADMATVRKAMSALQEQHTSDLASVRRTQELQQQQQQQLQQEAECKGCKSLQADMRSLQASQSTSDSQIAALSQQLLSFRMLMGSFASQIAAAAAPAQQLPARAAAEASNSALPGLPSNSDRVRQPVADLQLANGVIRELHHGDSGTGHADAGTPRSSSSLSGSTHGAACYQPRPSEHGRPAKRARPASAGLASGTSEPADTAQTLQQQDAAPPQRQQQGIPALAFEKVDADLERILQPCISKEDTVAIAASLSSAMQGDSAFLECFMAGFETALLECADLLALHTESASCQVDEGMDEGCSTPQKLPPSEPLIEEQPFTPEWCNRQSCAAHAVSRLIAFAAAVSRALVSQVVTDEISIIGTLRNYLHTSAMRKEESHQHILRLAPEQCSLSAAIVVLCRQENDLPAAVAYLCDLFLLHLPSCSQLLPPAAAALSAWPALLSESNQDVLSATLEAILHDLCTEGAASKSALSGSDSADVTAGSWSGSTAGQFASGQHLVRAACEELIRLGQMHWGWCVRQTQHIGISELHSRTAAQARNLLGQFAQTQTGAACTRAPMAAALCLCSRVLGWQWALEEVATRLLVILREPSDSSAYSVSAELLQSIARSAWCWDAPTSNVKVSLLGVIGALEQANSKAATSGSMQQVGWDGSEHSAQLLHTILKDTARCRIVKTSN